MVSWVKDRGLLNHTQTLYRTHTQERNFLFYVFNFFNVSFPLKMCWSNYEFWSLQSLFKLLSVASLVKIYMWRNSFLSTQWCCSVLSSINVFIKIEIMSHIWTQLFAFGDFSNAMTTALKLFLIFLLFSLSAL